MRELATRMPRIDYVIPELIVTTKQSVPWPRENTKSRSRKCARTSILDEIRGSTRPTAAYFNASL